MYKFFPHFSSQRNPANVIPKFGNDQMNIFYGFCMDLVKKTWD